MLLDTQTCMKSKAKKKRFSQEIIIMENTWLLLLLDVASIDQILRNINTQEAFFRLQKYAIKENMLTYGII